MPQSRERRKFINLVRNYFVQALGLARGTISLVESNIMAESRKIVTELQASEEATFISDGVLPSRYSAEHLRDRFAHAGVEFPRVKTPLPAVLSDDGKRSRSHDRGFDRFCSAHGCKFREKVVKRHGLLPSMGLRKVARSMAYRVWAAMDSAQQTPYVPSRVARPDDAPAVALLPGGGSSSTPTKRSRSPSETTPTKQLSREAYTKLGMAFAKKVQDMSTMSKVKMTSQGKVGCIRNFASGIFNAASLSNPKCARATLGKSIIKRQLLALGCSRKSGRRTAMTDEFLRDIAQGMGSSSSVLG
jgi:hypothetical protein